MDPITAIGLISLVISLAEQVCTILQLVCVVRDAPNSLVEVLNDTANHLLLLKGVQEIIENDEHNVSHFANLTTPNGPLQLAKKAIEELLSIVSGDEHSQLGNIAVARRFINFTLKDIAWPRKERRVRELHQELERHKASINMGLSCALTTITVEMAAHIDSRTEEIQGELRQVNDTISSMERRGILDYCLPSDGGMLNFHNERRALQEPETCNWISREVAFRKWLEPSGPVDNMTRFICVHGIPGAGKTVLASSLVERTAFKCKSRGYAYYYCLYSRNQDETVPFLKWVLRQLCKQKDNLIPRLLKRAYETEEALSVENLLTCLEHVSQADEHRVYIIIDAVDESKPRENLMKVLSRIGTEERFWKVSLIFTSREESDIMGPINQLGSACVCISMSNNNVREDIKRYVHAQLTTSSVFTRWGDPAFIEEVETTLTQKATGMFRWAVCQLDVLKRKINREEVRCALKTLPHDIFSTYERILTEIPKFQQEFARTALALICSNTAEIPSAEVLVTACLFNVPLNEIGRYTVETLKESCGSLITLSTLSRPPPSVFPRDNERMNPSFRRCSLAHYTVREYLFSRNVAEGPAKFFALSDSVVGDTDLKVIFTGVRNFGINTGQPGRGRNYLLTRYEEYCLKMTEIALKYRRNDIQRNDEIMEKVTDSLTPRLPHFSYLEQARMFRTTIRLEFQSWFKLCSLRPTQLFDCAGVLLNLSILRWPDLANRYLNSPKFRYLSREEKKKIWTATFKLGDRTETILGYCLRERYLNLLRVFVSHGASFEHEPEALYTAMKAFEDNDRRAHEALTLLLRAGANPNPTPIPSEGTENHVIGRGFAFTPLQFAIYQLAYDWIELLLDEGADVNKIGTVGGILPFDFDDFVFDDIDPALRGTFQQTALELCFNSKPPWTKNFPQNEEETKENIANLLKRYGAEEPRHEEGDAMVIDNHSSVMEPINRKMNSEDSAGHHDPLHDETT